ncbi:glycosyltransferase [Candidatus Woesearchaeota archaeon]|nr:glycosyltransferase [Candidatus Woesearchaeota archaeon]
MISIIIPTWNEEKYLPKLLECIKKQTYKDYEIIVADANSKDKTREVAKKYNCRIVKGGVPAVGRNNGAKVAKGDILLFLDADVTIQKDLFFIMQYIYPHMVGQCIFSAKSIHKKLDGFDQSILFAEDNDYVNRSKRFCKFRILRTVKIVSSTRRFKYENRYILALKYVLCPFYRMVFGEIRTNIFNYRFDYLERKKD